MFTKREVQDALKALKLKQDMGYPSSRELIKMISSGGIINCPVTIEDIHRADFIWSKSVAEYKGKTRLKMPDHVEYNHVPRPIMYLLK